jgi:hypothetical protein
MAGSHLARATAFHCEGRLTRINLPLKKYAILRNSIINSRRQRFQNLGLPCKQQYQHGHSLKMQAHEMTAIACQNYSVVLTQRNNILRQEF